MSIAACGGESGSRDLSGATAASPPLRTPSSAPLAGDPVLIQIQITSARTHEGKVTDGSVLGDVALCPGGTTSGFSRGPTITTRLNCADGTLTIVYTPAPPTRVQGGTWNVDGGTGRYEGFRGGGSMVAVFDSDGSDTGTETFTGNVGS